MPIHTFYSWDTEVEQVNWYYDSESGELSGRHITCRVRTLGGRFYLQVKLPAHENSSGAVSRIELERELTSIPEFISGQELSEFSGAGWTSRCKAARLAFDLPEREAF